MNRMRVFRLISGRWSENRMRKWGVVSLRTLSLLLLGLFVLPQTLPAADTWSEHTRAGEWAFVHGRMDSAETEFRAALKIAQSLSEDDPRLEESLRNLGRLFEHQGELDRAEPLYQLLLAAEEHRLGEDSPEILETLAALARTAIPAGDHPVAMESLRRYLRIASGLDQVPNEDQYCAVLSTLAHMEAINEEGDAAILHQRQATERALSNPGLETSDRVAALENLARFEFRFGDAAKGEAAIRRESKLLAGDSEPAAARNVLLAGAQTALDQGAWEAAAHLAEAVPAEALSPEEKYQQARIRADALWKSVRLSSSELVALAAAADNTPERQAADAALEELLDLERRDQAFGSGIDQTLGSLVRVSLLRGRVDEALKYQEEIIQLRAGKTGKSSTPTIEALKDRLELVLLDPSHIDQAVQAGRALIAAEESAFGENSPELLPDLRRQLEILVEAREKREARKLKKRIRKLER